MTIILPTLAEKDAAIQLLTTHLEWWLTVYGDDPEVYKAVQDGRRLLEAVQGGIHSRRLLDALITHL